MERDSSFNLKINLMMIDLKTKGISENLSAPILYRWLWRIGIKVKPPLFQGYFPQSVIIALVFGSIFSLAFLPVSSWLDFFISFCIAFVCSGAFGVWGAHKMINRAKSLGLPEWNKYSPSSSSPGQVAKN